MCEGGVGSGDFKIFLACDLYRPCIGCIESMKGKRTLPLGCIEIGDPGSRGVLLGKGCEIPGRVLASAEA